MAFRKIFLIITIIAIVLGNQHEIQTKDKAEKTLATENEQKTRSANPGPDRGAFKKLSRAMNRTDSHRRKNEHFEKLKLNLMNSRQNDDGAIRHKASNDTNSLSEKMKALREGNEPKYIASDKSYTVPQVSGVFCNFEGSSGNSSYVDTCMWTWNASVSSNGLGFKVLAAADIALMNSTSKGFRFSGPSTDGDGNEEGNFLYLPVDPTMENMVIKSPPFRGLWEFCKFEAMFHQSRMQNASIRLVSEATMSEVQWILQEVAGNNFETWYISRFMIGKMQQEVRIMVEITKPPHVDENQPLPHIAIDNIRMVECLPEPPVSSGECKDRLLKCNIMKKESCIKSQQICDLVKDCDDGSDENQICDKMPKGSYCNFEQDNCGFENVPQPILKWSRHSGPTPTDMTGPNYDHTCGPPDHSPTKVAPPLLPAHMNNTNPQCVGYYYFVNMNVTGPNQKKADFASTAVMKSRVFNPPPKVHGNITSVYYNCCMIRFYYQQYGRNYGSMSMSVVQITKQGNVSTSLWFSTKNKGENWFRASIFLPNITGRYYLQFKTRMGMRIYSDSAIDDFSMAPECFGLNIDPEELGDYNYYDPIYDDKTSVHVAFANKTYYKFSTCGATGRFGPTQEMCDVAYYNTSVSVTVVSNPPYQGIQVWEVPEEGLYTIISIGASGGLGSSWTGVAHGASARGLFQLHRGERVYMLIGQSGTNACKKTLSSQEGQDCTKKLNVTAAVTYRSKTHEVRNTHVNDGGGGGGGGTFVFVLDKEGHPHPLIVAGGGGGISVGTFMDDGSQHAKPYTNTTPGSGYMYGEVGRTSGAGGGWFPNDGPITPGFEVIRGAAANEGGVGGKACTGDADGGFGGGGGGCLRGGGGGGWRGGNTNEEKGYHGGGGWSYIDPIRSIPDFNDLSLALRTGPGEVLIVPAIHDCGCAYRCVSVNEYRSAVRCYCPARWSRDASDPTKCILEDPFTSISWVLIIVLSVVVSICALVVVFFCLYLYNTYQRKKEAEYRQKRLLEQEVQLHRLRNGPGGSEYPLSMAFNPHYGSESMHPQGIDVRGLPQVSRESLKLVKALGQGAFGEVYQGLYRHRSNDSEMPVAVKTLPELSTGQAESDFLMEAAIMAKFNHPNVVHLIGVCFDRHPRFIVLELLAGGDLKNFLRESRPKPERATALTMKDLLLCSIDVCKGCRYLEAKRFIHRDIAARNCLLTSRSPGRVVKIADFGMARDIYRADYYKKGGKAMLPIKWMPPEAYVDGMFTVKTDVWSFGVLLWEVFSLGVMPYTGCANREVMDMVSGGGRLEKPYGCPSDVYRLMCECWNPMPQERPSFVHIHDRLQMFSQDPEIVNAPLPVVRSLMPQPIDFSLNINGRQRACWQRAAACDYLVPKSPQDNPPINNSSTDNLLPHSKSPTAAQEPPETDEDSPYQRLRKASQEYGNIPAVTPRSGAVAALSVSASAAEIRNTKFLPSNSTDRLLSSVEGATDEDSDAERSPDVWETSFTEPPARPAPAQHDGPAVDKLISITPTSPKPPENALSLAIDKNQKNTLVPEKKPAPIASPDPPRINARPKEPPKLQPKPKPLCLDAAQLEQNLNALKKNSGSVNLNTMNILPPYINVVTPNKRSEAKTIQIDPKKAVIHDLQSPKEEPKEEKGKMKQSSSSASLLNGPMTDVPYADSDNASSSSGGNANMINQKNKQNDKENNDNRIIVKKQGSNGGENTESEISC